ncbi:MAG: LPP20 family lipoprotein [Bacteroidales bacterium]|nr:LPP20 family lipoprotein [Bacteroidales bacterium]
MKKFQIILCLQLLVLISSCQIGKKYNYEKKDMPEWVVSKPQTSLYYIGVSSSPKRGFLPADYQANAQQKALGDLASSISVNIESTSVLSIIETNYKLNENFSSDITASTNQTLENYELVDTWENEEYYWVYYKLSKAVYASQKAQQKEQSILDAKNKYYQGRELLGRDLHYNAFQFYVEALTALKPYLGENTLTNINGEDKDLGNEIFVAIADFVNNLKINFNNDEIKVKKAVEIDNEILSFIITDKNNKPVSGIPVKINFTGSGLLRNSEVSANDGKVYCSIRKITSQPNHETLTVCIDMLSFSRAAKDHIVRSIIKNMPASENKMRVIVEKPNLKIDSKEAAFDNIRKDQKLKTTFEGLLNNEFFVNPNLKPDFTLKITSNTIKNGEYYGESQVIINYTFDLTDNNGNIIFRKTRSDEYSGTNYQVAANKAYIEVAKSIERTIVRELISSINK